MTGRRQRTSLAVTILALLMFGPGRASAKNVIAGAVKNASGQTVAGALVKIKGANTGLSFLVVSQAQGRYSSPGLPIGKYSVQAFGGADQSDVGTAEIVGGQPALLDLTLNRRREIPPPEKKMTNLDYAKLMPEGDGKQIITTRCVLCHGLDRIVPTRHTGEQWQKTIARMSGFIAERTDLQEKIHRGPLSDEERNTIVDYVTTNFGPGTPALPEPAPPQPDQHLPQRFLQGSEAKYIAMEFDPRTRAEEYEIAVDSQGNAWFSGVDTDFWGRFDAKTLTFVPVAAPTPKVRRALAQIAVDPRDNVWILDNGPTPDAELLRYDPRSKKIQTFNVPAPPAFRSPLNTMRFVDGFVWGSGNSSSRIVKLDTRTGKITDYHVPGGSHPYGMAIGADKTIWYTAMYNNEVVKLDPGTGKLTPYKVPDGRSGLRRMQADTEGNLWIGSQDAGKLVKLDTRTGQVTEYAPPTADSGPYSVDVDTTRNLIWFTEREADKIGRFDPRTNTFAEFPLPSAGTASRRILLDPTHRNRVWWGGARIGYLEAIP